MLCERCGENEATIHLTTTINGQKREISVCQSCYREIKQQQNQQQNPNDPFRSSDPFGFGNFDDLFRSMRQGAQRPTQRPIPQPDNNQRGNLPPQNGRGGLLHIAFH